MAYSIRTTPAILTLADDSFVSNDINQDLNTFIFKSVVFRDAGGTIVTPTAGTVKFEITEHPQSYGKWKPIPVNGGTTGEFPAADADSLSEPANAFGRAHNYRVTFTGVTGAVTAEVICDAWRI